MNLRMRRLAGIPGAPPFRAEENCKGLLLDAEDLYSASQADTQFNRGGDFDGSILEGTFR